MSFRRRLLLLFAFSVGVSVAVVTSIVSTMTRRAFDQATDTRTAALVQQFRREFTRRGEEVSRKAETAASSPQATRMAVAAAQPIPDYSGFLDAARELAQTERLDFLEFADNRGTIISSAQWPAKFGYKEPMALWPAPTSPFLKEEETPHGAELGLFAVHALAAGDSKLSIIGGVRLDRTFLLDLDLPNDMRVMLYEKTEASDHGFSSRHLITPSDSQEDAGQLAALIESVELTGREASVITTSKAGEEMVNAFPLSGENNQLLGIFLVGSSRQIYNQLRREIRLAALIAATAGLVLAVLLSSWAAARVTRPLEQLAEAAREIAMGNWKAFVSADSRDEVGELADALNRMAGDLLEQRERLLQSERLAAWREAARRLAHELKNPLFPLQLTVENLVRARSQGPEQFEEIFAESATTLLSEINRLKNTVAHFGEFSKVPKPQLEKVRVDELLQHVASVHRAQLQQASVECRVETSGVGTMFADPDLLHRALSNLMLNAIEAMPTGGTICLKARQNSGWVELEVSDTGVGLSPSEAQNLFTPYYTSKQHGTGLGLAIVHSIITDHGGSIRVESQPARGTTFMIELPANHDAVRALPGNHA
ncbi:MAG: HAMP domain-containing histidine kinase [Acidobacteria bacterium]|nr:HAMP domain-containing histidine kinase [Acidobacteriota bacterium]